MSVFSTIGGVAKIVLGGATAADGISDIRKEKKRKQQEANDTFYADRIEEIETEEESEETED